jgi:lysophospholipase L1-like esterase
LKTKIIQNLFSFTALAGSLVLLLTFTSTKPAPQMASSRTLLCLGDSYTVGESVLPDDNFPNQTVQLLRIAGCDFESPEIIAKTGWTTAELKDAMNKYSFKPFYNFVTLLIGVNDQYRGRPADEYKPQFEALLKQAILYANKNASHVIVLSIPDWGVTPFAKDRDGKKIAADIDAYNMINKQVAEQYKVHYINITPGTREAASDLSFISADGLHPSDKEYARWATKVAEVIWAEVKK